ncbi:MAG: YegS/Rv2252/BmrU family lipid kinase [Bacillota bacterium]
MKKLKLIYNPFSGNKTFKNDLDICVDVFQSYGYEVHLFRIMKDEHVESHIKEMGVYDIIVVSGGDGTVNIVLNAMMKYDINAPLAIIPSGTANDFATFLGFKTGKVEQTCRWIMESNPHWSDLGLVNDELYFINVCAGGLLTNVSQTVGKELKNSLGLLSYYIKGMEQLVTFHKGTFRITTSTDIYRTDLYLYMILNSSGTGGFLKLAPEASISDGKFDFVGFKQGNLLEIPNIFLQVLRGEHMNNPNILYLQDDYFKIECLNEDFTIPETTVDGELGPNMPLEVKLIPKAIQVFVHS